MGKSNNKQRGNGSHGNKNENTGNTRDMQGNFTSIKDGKPKMDRSAHGRGGIRSNKRGENDVSWYSTNEQLLRDSASLAFSNALGNKIELSAFPESGVSNLQNYYLPGIISLEVCPMPGNAQETNSPVNIAARNIYSYVRYANSGHANYDIPDLMLYLLAMDQVFTYYQYMARVYGIARYYEMYNRYTGKSLITAMGVDYDDIIKNLANFRQGINVFAEKAGALCVPSSMPYFLRHNWMYSNVYRDADSIKSQFYLYTPERFLKYVETSDQGNKLVPFWFNGYTDNQKTIAGLKDHVDLLERGNELLDAIMNSEDCGIMSGDILKAYGAGNLFSLRPVEETYTVAPIYNEEVLTQFHNAFILTDTTSDISASFGTIAQKIVGSELAPILYVDNNYTSASPRSIAQRILDLPYNVIDPGSVMVATRCHPFVSCFKSSGAGTAVYEHAVLSCGSEVVVTAKLYLYSWDSAKHEPKLTSMGFSSCFNASNGNLTAYLSKFDWHPIIYSVSTTNIGRIIGDLQNYTIINVTDLMKMDETALLSEFDTPQAAAYNGGR